MNVKGFSGWPPIIRQPLIFGAVGGICAIAFRWATMLLDKNPLDFQVAVILTIFPIFIFLAIKDYRGRFNQGELRFWQGMTVGFFTYLTMTAISLLGLYILLKSQPQLIEQYVAQGLALMEKMQENVIEQMGQATYDQTYKDVAGTNLSDVILDDFLKKLIGGLFLTIIVSVILRK